MIYPGFYRGVVTNNNDPEMRGRIKCIISDVTGATTESAWCEPCVTVAYENGGDFCIPQLQETVWIAFEKGDVKFPLYFGSWWTPQKTPIGANYATREQIRVISFANCLITMNSADNTLSINVGGGNAEITVANGTMTLNGTIQLNGSINATGDIHSPNIDAIKSCVCE